MKPIFTLKHFYDRYERIMIPTMLIAGTALDFVTFKTISIESSFILLAVYILVAGLMIVVINMDNKLTTWPRLKIMAPVINQFLVGALLSGSLVFYWFSGALSVSWPIVIFIALLMTTNEVFRHFYLKAEAQIGILFFIVFSFFSLALPYAFNSLNSWLFVFSGAVSLLIIYLFVLLLAKSSVIVQLIKHRIILIVSTVFVFMNVLYFGNIIPPIPLSLREAGIYHSITKTDGEYLLQGETESWIDRFLPGQNVHITVGETLYAYTAIFAPTDLNTLIVHDWQFYDEATGDWVSQGKYSFNIAGGRQDGFRGYSQKSAIKPGKWQVLVETPRGQVLGRIPFTIIMSPNLTNQ